MYVCVHITTYTPIPTAGLKSKQVSARANIFVPVLENLEFCCRCWYEIRQHEL